MKITSSLIFSLFLVLTLAACQSETAPEPVAESPEAAPEAAPEVPQVRMEDGVQVVEIHVGQMGYEPREIPLQAGVPARLVFTRTVDNECSAQVQIPAFGVEKTDLPMNEPTAIEFTPDETGEFQMVCGMDMVDGTLIVQS